MRGTFVRGMDPLSLWTGVEALTVEGDGRKRLVMKHGTGIDQNAHRRFAAFVRQASSTTRLWDRSTQSRNL